MILAQMSLIMMDDWFLGFSEWDRPCVPDTGTYAEGDRRPIAPSSLHVTAIPKAPSSQDVVPVIHLRCASSLEETSWTEAFPL